MDDQIEMDDDEIISVFIREVGTLFGQGGVEAEAVTEGETRGFVRMRLSPFLENPATYDSEVEKWCQEMELFESLLETYRLLLLPGALTIFGCLHLVRGLRPRQHVLLTTSLLQCSVCLLCGRRCRAA